MNDEEKLKIETVIMNIASNVPHLPKERVQKIVENLIVFLAKGPGHVGYGILKKYRERGYATMGLALAFVI